MSSMSPIAPCCVTDQTIGDFLVRVDPRNIPVKFGHFIGKNDDII